MIICDINVQHDMDKYYNQWRYYITIFITLFTTYRRTVFTIRGFASNITGHFLFYASIYENKIVIGLTRGNDGYASTGAARYIEHVLCQYIKLIYYRADGVPRSVHRYYLYNVGPQSTLETCNYFCMHHGGIVGPHDNIGMHSGVSWIQIASIPKA